MDCFKGLFQYLLGVNLWEFSFNALYRACRKELQASATDAVSIDDLFIVHGVALPFFIFSCHVCLIVLEDLFKHVVQYVLKSN